jgi:hypothetical protein
MGRDRSAKVRARAAAAVAALALGGLTACGDTDPSGAGADVTLDDVQAAEEQLEGLESRVDALEDGALLDDEESAPDLDVGLFEDPRSFIGQEVDVMGVVTEVLDTDESVGAFLLGGDAGEPIPVIALDDPAGIAEGGRVSVDGTVVAVDRDGFDTDFGVPPDDVFEDPAEFFERVEGDLAISADRVTAVRSVG